MKRLLVGSLAYLIVAALPSARAMPARLPYDPSALRHADPFELCGSRWFGSDIESGDWEITFEKDGAITYTYKGRTFRNGSWQWQGNALYFETNKKFYEFRGTLQGNLIDGESWNVKGIRWHTSMYRLTGSK
jgi:hypothetical protein